MELQIIKGLTKGLLRRDCALTIRSRLEQAAARGLLQPVYDFQGNVNEEAAREGFSLEHLFVLRSIFGTFAKDFANDELLIVVNGFLEESIKLEKFPLISKTEHW